MLTSAWVVMIGREDSFYLLRFVEIQMKFSEHFSMFW